MLARRTFLLGAGALVAAPRFAFAAPAARARRDTLVVVLLRGGMDGLNVVVPCADPAYYKLRPDLSIPPPGSGNDAALPLDGYFGLNPDFAAVEPLFRDGKLAFVHATGLETGSRSHFECLDRVARGDPSGRAGGAWLDRHLAEAGGGGLRSVGTGPVTPGFLRGSPYAKVLAEVGGLGLSTGSGRDAAYAAAWSRLFGATPDLGQAVHSAFEAGEALAAKASVPESSADVAAYPDTPFGRQLRLVAGLIKADLGLEAASLEFGGWDHHDRETPRLAASLRELGAALAAFDTDLGTRMASVDVVAYSEFGRRAAQNASLGTDHGSGGLMLLLGGGVAGGLVYALWPGLGPNELRDGDLEVTTDQRTVLAELLAKRLGNGRIDAVFPGYAPQPYMGAFRGG